MFLKIISVPCFQLRISFNHFVHFPCSGYAGRRRGKDTQDRANTTKAEQSEEQADRGTVIVSGAIPKGRTNYVIYRLALFAWIRAAAPMS